MSHDAGSHEHRSHAHRGGSARWGMIAGWVVAGLLAAYLAYGMLNQEDGNAKAPFSADIFYAAMFWVPVALAAAASVAGIVWTARTYVRREKPSLLWMRHAFTFGVVAAVLLAAVPRDPVKGTWYIAWVAAALVAAQSSMFAYAAFREYRRTLGGGHRSRHDDGDDGDGDGR